LSKVQIGLATYLPPLLCRFSKTPGSILAMLDMAHPAAYAQGNMTFKKLADTLAEEGHVSSHHHLNRKLGVITREDGSHRGAHCVTLAQPPPNRKSHNLLWL
jgi:hypothetical protein